MSTDTDQIYVKYARRLLDIGNPTQAALEVGVPKDTVNEFLMIAKQHPKVQEILSADDDDETDFAELDQTQVRKKILKQLWREAQYRGQGAQQAARISALKAIGEITGIEAPKKIDVNTAAQGGIMMIPMMDADMWAESAEKMQKELKDKARE